MTTAGSAPQTNPRRPSDLLSEADRRRAAHRTTASYVCLAVALLLFPAFLTLALQTVPIGGRAGDPSAVPMSYVVMGVAWLTSTAGVVAATLSLRIARGAAAWPALVCNALIAAQITTVVLR